MTPPRPLRVAIDLTQVDNQTLGSGQFRYTVDLVQALCTLEDPTALTLLGSFPRPVEGFLESVERFPDRCRYVELAAYRGRGYYYYDLARLSWWLSTHAVDVFHQPHTNIPPAARCPIVATVYHYYDDPVLFATRPHRYYRWALRHRTDLVIALSESTRADVHQHYGVPLTRIRTVPLGLSRTLARPAEPHGGSPYVLSPYNLSGPKNLRSLILAWPSIAACDPSLRLILYGRARVTSSAEQEFEALLAATPHADRIQRVGHVDDAMLASLYEGCRLFVFPTTVEGFGYPLLEAMSRGACCITRDASAMKEVGGDAVCLVETLNPGEIAKAAASLLGDEGRRRALGGRARARARAFTVEAMARKTLECYRSVIA